MITYHPFNLARLPRIVFGRGEFSKLANYVAEFGHTALVVTGAQSFQASPYWADLHTQFEPLKINLLHVQITGEPSPTRVDEIVAEFKPQSIDVVLGIGGGSVLDAAKAISGLLKINNKVMDFLEGVGPELDYVGPTVPFIAVPTTAGTGSEATKNAVLSVQGEQGFKKSFRDDKLVAEYALVDPALLARCPQALIAANGMDALTQLIESYVSLRANVMTDALAISGLRAVRDGLIPWYSGGAEATEAQDKMAYASMTSGITLAQVGLGSVHGLASPLGAFYPIPHGAVCGTLVAGATQINIEALLAREPENIALAKYARLADVLAQKRHGSKEQAWQALVELLTDWTERMQLPYLDHYGVKLDAFDKIVSQARGSSMKTNPIILTDDEIKLILLKRLSRKG